MISAVIFDLDGVLLDSEPFHDQTTTSILESYGAKGAYEAIRPYVGRSSEDLWAAMKTKYDIPASVEDLVERIARNLRKHLHVMTPPLPFGDKIVDEKILRIKPFDNY